MAWVAPLTWSTGQIVTAAQLNEQIRDNETYLKTETDKIDDISLTSPARAMDTIYQNTTTASIKVVSFSIRDSTGTSSCTVYIGSTSPPVTAINSLNTKAGTANEIHPVIFIVPPQFYYTASTTFGTPILGTSAEWNLH